MNLLLHCSSFLHPNLSFLDAVWLQRHSGFLYRGVGSLHPNLPLLDTGCLHRNISYFRPSHFLLDVGLLHPVFPLHAAGHGTGRLYPYHVFDRFPNYYSFLRMAKYYIIHILYVNIGIRIGIGI